MTIPRAPGAALSDRPHQPLEHELLRSYALAKRLAEALELAGLREAHRVAVALRQQIYLELLQLHAGKQVGDRG